MNTLKMMFGGGADVAQLAEMIRRFGRGEDKILAHITPEEAAKLKEMGGSGTINPMTGLPEFQEEDYLAQARAAEPVGYYGTSQTGFNEAVDAYFDDPTLNKATERQRYDIMNPDRALPGQNFYQDFQYTGDDSDRARFSAERFNPDVGAVDIGFGPGEFTAPATPAQIAGRTRSDLEETYPEIFAPTTAERAERGLQDLRGTLDRYPNLTRLGTAGANILAQGLIAQRANRGREAEAARLRERAAPLRAAETEAMARATGGGLTPQQARELEITQARARQGIGAQNLGAGSAASGVLAGQMQRARSAARQESLQSALDLAQIADRYERAAIQEDLAKDADLSRLFAEVMGKEIQAASRTEASKGRA